MVILIYGEDTFRSRAWLRELETKFREKFDPQGYNLNRFSGSVSISEFRSSLTAPPFLGKKRMIVATDLISTSGKKEELSQIILHVPESSIVIFWESGSEKDFAKILLFTKIKRLSEAKIYSFPEIRGLELERWVKARCAGRGPMFDRGAMTAFIAKVGSDLWFMDAELEKLAARGIPVTITDVDEHVRGTIADNLFGFIDMLSIRNTKAALSIFSDERERGTTIPHLLSMIARQFRMLMQAASYRSQNPQATSPVLASEFGWHPFVAKKVLSELNGFSNKELIQISESIFKTDLAIKSGALDQETAFDLLLKKLCQPLTDVSNH